MANLKNYQIPSGCSETIKELTFQEVSLEIGVNYMTLSKKISANAATRQFWRSVADASITLLNRKIALYTVKINKLQEWKKSLDN